MSHLSKRFQFLFPADTGRWLAVLRVGMGVQVMLYAICLREDWNLIFAGANRGLLGGDVGDAITLVQSPLIPRLAWIIFALSKVGLSESAALAVVWWSLLVLSGILVIGLYSRPIAIAVWFLQLACAKSAGLLSYGSDNLTTIGLFYLMIAPFPDPWSADRLFFHQTGGNPRLLGFHRRVLQLHLCLIYFFSGLTKCLGADWWNGVNIWRALTVPPFDLLPIHWIALLGFLLPGLGIGICLLEMTYPLLVWWRRLRKPMLVAICALHLGIALMMGMILFGLIMILLNLAAFWPDEESGGAEVGSAKRESWPNTIRERATEKIAAEGI